MSGSNPKPVARDPTPFLLDEKKETDYDKYRGPVTKASLITPLIDGMAVFQAMEEYIYNAKTCVFVTSWSFDPGLPITSTKVRKLAGSTWLDLLVDVAKRGVQVNLLMNDFDPVFQAGEHNGVWHRYRTIVEAADKAKLPADRLQVVCSRHQAEFPGLVVEALGLKVLYPRLVTVLNAKSKADRKAALRDSPGLWEIIVLGRDQKAALRDESKTLPAWPAAHHQKVVLVDEKRAFVGGLNHIDINREDSRHQRFPDRGWHDGFALVEGPVVADVMRGVYGRWNEEHPRAKAFIDAASKQSKDFTLPYRTTSNLPARITKAPDPDLAANLPCQVHRTVSRDFNVLTKSPNTTCSDVLEGYLKAIGAAEKFVYIENQYFREKPVADAIAARGKKTPDLNVILLLPFLAEELIKDKGDPITQHGAALQFQAIKTIADALGSRFGVFSPFTLTNPSRLIYVHTKILLVDDFYANVGSANVNPRSFSLDTEMNIAWCDEASAKSLRLDLWREQLGSASDPGDWDPKTYVSKWSAVAASNQKSRVEYRKGFILPFENKSDFKPNPKIPDALASLMRPVDSDGLA